MRVNAEEQKRKLANYFSKEKTKLDGSTSKRLKSIGLLSSSRNNQDVSGGSDKDAAPYCSCVYSNVLMQKQRDGSVISVEDWKPKSIIYHDDDFWNWINSITFGFFVNKINYDKFELYKAQAYYWLEISRNPYETGNADIRHEIIMTEYDRINKNSLYFALKYGWVKEGSDNAGKIKYLPKEHNAVIFYLLDCGYSFLFGKPRQIFATTTMGLFICKKLITQENFYMKFITEDQGTGIEIINDKVKAAFSLLPPFLRPTAARDYISGFYLGKKKEKGKYSRPNSRIEVLAPKKTAINGGSPQIVFVDEVGTVPDLIPMILEARPTMFIDKNQDGNLTLVRQIALWGTGVSSDKGKNAFQSLWTSTIDFWEQKNFKESIFIPLFFSWHSRCNENVYKEEMSSYYGGSRFEDVSAEEQKQIFHMHYPSTWRDMFSLAANKLVSRDLIINSQARIRQLPLDQKPIYGYFEPIYDFRCKLDENIGIPFKIIGARFVSIDDDDFENEKAAVMLLDRPERGWQNRYFQGTDPIAVETGLSNFASCVYDAELNKPVCILNHRKAQDHKMSFLQALLMSLYYDVERENGLKIGIPELCENNIGTNYKDFRAILGYDKNFVMNGELMQELKGGSRYWGVDTKSYRKLFLVSKLRELINTYSDNIDFDVIWRQLDTYTSTMKSGGESWGPADKRLYRDDVLDALVFSYICRLVFYHKPPMKISDSVEKNVSRTKYRIIRLPNGSLTREPYTEKISHNE